jgi:transcriptional regulator with XRE-family HTH domain
MSEVAKTFRDARNTAKLTRKQLAEKMEVSVSTIARWERDGSAPMRKAHKLFEFCGVAVKMVFFNSGVISEEVCLCCYRRGSCEGNRVAPLGESEGTIGLTIQLLGLLPQDCPYIAEQVISRTENED